MNSASMVLMVLSVLAPVLASSRASATTLFSDAFQNTTDLSSWTPGLGDAVIATAPDGSHGLSFNGIEENGDINTNSVFTSSTGSFTVSFDIYGNCGHTSGCGRSSWRPARPATSWDGFFPTLPGIPSRISAKPRVSGSRSRTHSPAPVPISDSKTGMDRRIRKRSRFTSKASCLPITRLKSRMAR